MRVSIVVALLAVLSGAELLGRNLLLITVDSCRADRLGVYGRRPTPTPEIDAWAQQGTVFMRAYSTSAWTAPGVVSILSGLYPPTHGVNNRDRIGSPQLVTLLKILREAGYQAPHLNGVAFEPYREALGLAAGTHGEADSRSGELLIQWLENHGSDQKIPFFLWYHNTVLSQPYGPLRGPLKRSWREPQESPALQAALEGSIVPVGSVRFSEQDRVLLDQLYDDSMRQLDAFFGRVLETLKKLGRDRDTLVVLTADHGTELLDHGLVGHASTSLQARLYEEQVRIPLILSWPGRVPARRVEGQPVSQIDLLPTILSMLERDVPAHLEGIDLLAQPLPPRPLYFESSISGEHTTREHEEIWVRAVLEGSFKFISTEELYDLGEDPGETRNLVAQQPQLASRMRRRLETWLKASEEKGRRLFPSERLRTGMVDHCPVLTTPVAGQTLDYQRYTGAVILDWTGDLETTYLIEYDIGRGSRNISGIFEVEGNHQLLGPLGPELWHNLRSWNPFKLRVSPKSRQPCWGPWVTFRF